MSGLVLLGLLWAAVGFLLGIQWWRAREAQGADLSPTPQRSRARFGTDALDRSPQRARAMFGAYAAGAMCCAVGFPTRVDLFLVLGVVLVNLGTVYRYLVVALDHDTLDLPLLDLSAAVVADSEVLPSATPAG